MSSAVLSKEPGRKPAAEVRLVRILDIRPSPENGAVYRPFDPGADDDRALLLDIREHGIVEPLVVSEDGYILSGHRRYHAALALGMDMVPVRVLDVRHDACSADEWLRLLTEFNCQREKTLDEVLQEQIVATDPKDAHRELVQYRARKSRHRADTEKIDGAMCRATISSAKGPFLTAIQGVLEEMQDYLPISVRSLHYQLLNNPPLMHASKPESAYKNAKASYQSLDELVTRARLAGHIAWDAIKDDTRPVQRWNVHATPQVFLRKELDTLLRNYWRDLMQSQSNHIEVVLEKKTLTGIVEKVCSDYTIPVTSGGGYCSLPPRYEMAKRYKASGKLRLVLILFSDFDADGLEIAQSFARSMRDDFGIDNTQLVRAAITTKQIKKLRLVPNMIAKESSRNYQKFTQQYGEDVFELEAIPPADLMQILRETIDGVIDHDAFAYEQTKERGDAAFLDDARQRALAVLKSLIDRGAQ